MGHTMAICEKCWRETDSVDEYHRLLVERQDNPCTPEEQCGEVHTVRDFGDGDRHCACGKVKDAKP